MRNQVNCISSDNKKIVSILKAKLVAFVCIPRMINDLITFPDPNCIRNTIEDKIEMANIVKSVSVCGTIVMLAVGQ